jgi:metal-dependent amidase/aminoacylase/carboxypeptidase family protein
LETGWRAQFKAGAGQILAINSEMDALPGIGYSWGHNLITVSDVGVAVTVKATMGIHGISSEAVLLGGLGPGKSFLSV